MLLCDNQKTEVFSLRKTDGARVMLTIAYTNEIPPSAPNCLQLYNIIFKRSSLLLQFHTFLRLWLV